MMLFDTIESLIRRALVFITDYLPVKVIRDAEGAPFLYRYHIAALGPNGPGICIHRFCKSDPDRGYHDHPWSHSASFILAGKYDEKRVIARDEKSVITQMTTRNRWTINYLNGNKTFHRVIIERGHDCWTLFFFLKRSKIWSMISLDGAKQPMSTAIEDADGGWWKQAQRGARLRLRAPLKGSVIACVDIIVLTPTKILLVKRGKDPFKNTWALPGGRIEASDKDLQSAARRELMEETGVSVPLSLCKCVGNNDRDPRGFCISVVFIGRVLAPLSARAGDDAVEVQWAPRYNLPELAFDHAELVKEFL